MNNLLTEKRYLFLFLLLAGISSTYYLLVLGYYNSLLLDDYGFVVQYETFSSPFEALKEQYMTWQGRFSGYLLMTFFIELFGRSSNLFFYSFILLLSGYLSVYLLMSYLLKEVQRSFVLIVVVLLVNVSIMSLLEFSTFYWFCCSGYIFMIWASFFLAYFMIDKKLNKVVSYFFIILFSIYLGGSSETYTPLVILVLGLIFLIKLYNIGRVKLFFSKPENVKLFVSLVILLIGFIIVVIAPGNANRLETMDNRNPNITQFFINFIGAISIFMLRLLSKIHYYLLTFPLFLMLGHLLKKNNIEWLMQLTITKKWFLISLFLLIGFIVVAIFPAIVIMGWYAPLRSYSFISFVLMLYIGFWGIFIGYRIKKMPPIFSYLTIVSLIMLSSLSIYFSITEHPKAKKFKQNIVIRHDKLISLNNNNYKGLVCIKPITIHKTPTSYANLRYFIDRKKTEDYYFPYYRYYHSTDKLHFTNIGVKRYLKLDFDIYGLERE